MRSQITKGRIAKILKERRKAVGLRVEDVQAALAKEGVSVSPQTLYGWENGYRQPDADTFLILCEIYGIGSVAEITGNSAEDTQAAAPDSIPPEEALAAKLGELLKTLTPEQAALLCEIAARWLEYVNAKSDP